MNRGTFEVSNWQNYNYKRFNSIIFQAVIDANAKFIALCINAYRTNGESNIFKKSNFAKLSKIIKKNILIKKIYLQIKDKFLFVFIGDDAYPLKTNLMKPFPRRNLTNEKIIFSYRLLITRTIVECVFGIIFK